MNMRKPVTLIALCTLAGCVSVSGTQSFETSEEFSVPSGAIPAGLDTGQSVTIRAVGATDSRTFAQSVFKKIDDLRDDNHIDSIDFAIRIDKVRLTTNTNFAGVSSIRAELSTETDPIELCNRTLSERDQESDTIECSVDETLAESRLRSESGTTSPSKISVELEVSSGVTATRLTTVMAFDVEVDVGVSL